MSCFIVVYDLKKFTKSYKSFYTQIRTHNYATIAKCAYIIDTPLSAVELYKNLSPHVDEKDTLFIGELTGVSASHGLSPNVVTWVKKNLSTDFLS